MSTQQPPPPGSIRCPRCDATLGPEQDWCLNCGAPARTRLAPRPNWKAPVVVVATIAVLSGIALAVAFVSLTGDDDSPPPATTTTATAPSSVLTAPTTTVASAPAATVPPATTAPPVTQPTAPASTFTITTPTITAPATTSP